MINNKIFLKSVMGLVIPLAFQNLINVGVQCADVIMLGRVSETVLSAASLASQVNYIMNLTLFGLTSGAAVLTAQYWGKGDTKTIEKVLGIALRISICISLAFALISFIFPYQIMNIFSSEHEVIVEGVKYLRIICFSYIFSSISMVYLNIMRSVEKVLISTLIYSSSLLINIILNTILIFGFFFIPPLGIVGAAIATLTARIMEVLFVIIYDKKYNKIIKFKLSILFIKEKLIRKDFLNYSIPVIFNELLWGAGMAVNAAILGHLGSAAAAASSVVQVTRQLAMVFSFGIATATAITIGKVIGEGKIEVAKEYAKKFIILSIISGIFGSILILIIRPFTMSIMNLSSVSKGYLSVMMYVMTYYVIFQAFTCTTIVGIFRAGGDTKVGLIVDVITMWFGSILFGLLAAFVFKFSVPVVYVILLIDELLKIPLVIWRYKSYKWLNNVTR